MSNLVFKGAIIALLGKRALFARAGVFFFIAFGTGALILTLWP